MFKRAIVLLTFATLFFGTISTTAFAAPGKDLQIIPVIVNGQKVKFPDTEPYINTDGRTMVPVRFVSEKLGADVKWEADTQTAIIEFEGKNIRMSVGSKIVTVDGVTQELDTSAEFTDGRTMVPLRFVSEILNSKVEWDEKAHAVRVTDASYQAKVDAGEVKLDPWGREYSKNWDANWMKLTDLEGTKFYDFYGATKSREFLEYRLTGNYRLVADVLAKKIRDYYEAQLNVDYRTIDETEFVNAYLDNAPGTITMNSYKKSEATKVLKRYVAWVKENKVIAKGYADPEMSTVYYTDGLMVWIPTHFKFMIISAEDTAQTFMDNYDVSEMADSFKLEKGVWYDGYSVVSMTTNVANSKWGYDHGIRHTENMFYKGYYFYDILK